MQSLCTFVPAHVIDKHIDRSDSAVHCVAVCMLRCCILAWLLAINSFKAKHISTFASMLWMDLSGHFLQCGIDSIRQCFAGVLMPCLFQLDRGYFRQGLHCHPTGCQLISKPSILKSPAHNLLIDFA